MGIIGLETLVDNIYQESKEVPNQSILKKQRLKELRLVIDGNQLPYVLIRSMRNAHFGGNYDEIYAKIKIFLTNLKPFIEVIIFDGSKGSIAKAKKRTIDTIKRVANLANSKTKVQLDQIKHLENLKETLPLFAPMIIFKVVNELDIHYVMAENMADHAIASYANGYNQKNAKFTVLSRDSYFYVYNLDNGYVSWKHATDLIETPQEINENSLVNVFYLKNTLRFLEFKNVSSWIFLCVLLGDYDLGLEKNLKYFRANKIDLRNGNYRKLLDFFRSNESYFLKNKFQPILSLYVNNDAEIVNYLVDTFELKKPETGSFIESNQPIDSFDRVFVTLKDLRTHFIPCLVEDCNKPTPFEPVFKNDLFKLVYHCLFSKCYNSNEDCWLIDEIYRKEGVVTLNNESDELIESKLNKVGLKRPENCVYNYLVSRFGLESLNSELELFILSLVIWKEYLLKENRENCDKYVEALFVNFILISYKRILFDEKEFFLSRIFKKFCENRLIEIGKLVVLYDEMLRSQEVYPDLYFGAYLPVVHVLNEFQAVYFAVGALSKVEEMNFHFLSLDCLLNGWFACNYVLSETSSDVLTVYDLKEFVENTEILKEPMQMLRDMFKTVESNLEMSRIKLDFEAKLQI